MRQDFVTEGPEFGESNRRAWAVTVALMVTVGGFAALVAIPGHLGAAPAVAVAPQASPSTQVGGANPVPQPQTMRSFPAAGNDTFEGAAVLDFATPTGEPLPALILTGSFTVQRGNPTAGPDGMMEIPARLIDLELTGPWAVTGPWAITDPWANAEATLTLNPAMPSTGDIIGQSGNLPFPARSFFDVFVDITIGGSTLTNPGADNMSATITSIPPTAGTIYENSTGAPVPFVNSTGAPALVLVGGYFIVGLVPCLHFTENGLPIGIPVCNPKANDLRINFKPTPAAPCFLQLTLNGKNLSGPLQCPAGANDLEVFWGNPPKAPAVITKCEWTVNGKPLAGAPCLVPASAPANDFTFYGAPVTQVYWTIGGRLVQPPIPVPSGTNDVEFFRYSSGYPAAGNDTFTATAVVQLSTSTGAPLPDVVLSGSVTVMRSSPMLSLDGITGLTTELTAMSLTGMSPTPNGVPISMTLNPEKLSMGYTKQQKAGQDFPAQSFFDVFVDITIGGETYQNALADNLTAVLAGIPPPNGTIFRGPASGPLTITAPGGSSLTVTGNYLIVGTPPCFYFTKNGLPASGPICNVDANDLHVVFAQPKGSSCSVQFTSFGSPDGAPLQCPAGANDFEVHWNNTAAGVVISSCSWTVAGTILAGAPCVVPPPPGPVTDFNFSAEKVVLVLWSVNGKLLKPNFKTPAGANDVEFFGYLNSGLPAGGVDTFPASALVKLETPQGELLPAVQLTGTTTVERSNPEVSPETGLATIQTQLIALSLTGNTSQGPVELTLNDQMPSMGQVQQSTPGVAFPATSFFDVFTDISLNGETFHNAAPENMSTTLTAIPPSPGTIYQTPPGVTIPYYEPNGTPAFNLVGGYFISGLVGCFYFTNNSLPVGGPLCNPNSNDIEVNFTQYVGAVCSTQFQLGGAAYGAADLCPTTANQFEANWTGSASGPVITSCFWADSGVPVGSCAVPSPPPPNGFAFNLADITSVSWTANGQVVGKPVPAPAVGANDVELFF